MGLSGEAHAACGGRDEGPCRLEDRTYRAQTPSTWDGKSALPVLLHFHGWGRTGLGVLRNKRIAQAANRHGVLLLAPDGLGKSWSFWGRSDRDVRFVDAVIEDAKRRWPIDAGRVLISGFSYGGAMAWRVACARGDRYAGYLSIAGTLWNAEDEMCDGGPVRLLHVHGLKDNVMDLPLGPEDDDPLHSMTVWRRTNDCGDAPDRVLEERAGTARYQCHYWDGCGGPALGICLHPSGHHIPKTWLDKALPKLLKMES